MSLPGLLQAIAGQLGQQLAPAFPTIQSIAGQGFAVTPPSVDVYPEPGLFLEPSAMGVQNREGRLVVRARVVATDWDNGQSVLLTMMDVAGSGSIVQALDYDNTFGGSCDSSIVESQTGFNLYADPGSEQQLLGAEWLLRVLL